MNTKRGAVWRSGALIAGIMATALLPLSQGADRQPAVTEAAQEIPCNTTIVVEEPIPLPDNFDELTPEEQLSVPVTAGTEYGFYCGPREGAPVR